MTNGHQIGPLAGRGRSGSAVLRQRSDKPVERRGAVPGGLAEPAATRAGADLRAARERLGWTLEAVSDGLRIRLCHLEALEEGDVSQLPGNAYVVGHVRAYARALGLDAPQMVGRFKAEAAAVGRRTELVFPVPMPERGLPAGAAMLLGLVLSIGAYAGWYWLSGEGRLPAETAAAVPERLASLAEQAVPASAVTAPATPAATVPISAGPAPALGALEMQAPGARALADLSAAADAQSAPVLTAGPADVEPAPPVAAVSPASAAASSVRDPAQDRAVVPGAPDASRIVLRATADAWVQVKDRGGMTLLNRTLRAGETWPVPERGNLLLTTGNAGATEILVDGAATPGLGPSGAVRRDLPLDADLARGGRLSAALPPRPVPVPVRQ